MHANANANANADADLFLLERLNERSTLSRRVQMITKPSTATRLRCLVGAARRSRVGGWVGEGFPKKYFLLGNLFRSKNKKKAQG